MPFIGLHAVTEDQSPVRRTKPHLMKPPVESHSERMIMVRLDPQTSTAVPQVLKISFGRNMRTVLFVEQMFGCSGQVFCQADHIGTFFANGHIPAAMRMFTFVFRIVNVVKNSRPDGLVQKLLTMNVDKSVLDIVGSKRTQLSAAHAGFRR